MWAALQELCNVALHSSGDVNGIVVEMSSSNASVGKCETEMRSERDGYRWKKQHRSI